MRTGDTPQKERAAMLRNPPDILITTPESLYLLLTSRARENLKGVRTLILDEVHAVAGTKRGAHLALSVERLRRLDDEPFQRIGLSATQRPMEEIGRFVSGARDIQLVDAGRREGARPESRRAGRGHARAGCGTGRRLGRILRARSGRRSTLRSSSSSKSTARRSSSSTTAASQSGSRSGSTSSPRKKSRAPITARSRASSASRSRSC